MIVNILLYNPYIMSAMKDGFTRGRLVTSI